MQPISWRSRINIGGVAVMLFAFIYSSVFWSTTVHPYASLHLPEKIDDIRFSPDGATLLTMGYRSWSEKGWIKMPPLRVWDVEAGAERFSVADDWSSIEHEKVCFSPNGRLFAADQPCYELTVWDARTGEAFMVSPRICLARVLQFSPDGRFILFESRSDSGPDGIIFWDFRARKEIYRIKGSTRQVIFAADGRSFASVRRENVNARDRFTQVLLWTLDPAVGPRLDRTNAIQAASVVFSPNLGMYAIVDPDGRGFSLWDMANGARRFADRYDEPDTGDVYLRFLQDGRILAAENDGGKIIVWNTTPKPKRIGSFIAPQPWGLGFPESSPEGNYLAVPLADEYDNVSVWPRSLDVGAALVNLATLKEDARLVVKSDRMPYNGHCCPYPSTQFSPDGKLLAVGAMETQAREPYLNDVLPSRLNPFPPTKQEPITRIWDVAARKELVNFPRCTVQFSPDGKVLAALHDDQTIDLWRLPLGKPYFQIALWSLVYWLTVMFSGWFLWRLLSRRRAKKQRQLGESAA